MDLWLPPKPAIIIPGRLVEKPVRFRPAWAPGLAVTGFCVPSAADFPTVQTTNTTSGTIATSPGTTFNLPAGIIAGDLILYFVRHGNTTLTFPAGWTNAFDQLEGNGTVKGGLWYSTSASGSTVTISSSSSTGASMIGYRISNFVGTPEAATATGVTTTTDPPNLAPSWGSKLTLWIAMDVHQLNAPTAGPPANYSNQLTNTTQLTAERKLQAASENPGTWTITPSQGWLGATVAVQGTG